MKQETTDPIEAINFCFLSSQDLGQMYPSEQLPLLTVLALQMGIKANNTLHNEYREPKVQLSPPLNLNNAQDMLCAKLQLSNCVLLN